MGRNKKGTLTEPKEVSSINFDKSVLRALDKRSKLTGVSVSKIVNMLCRRHVMTDEAFYLEMQRYHLEKAQGYQFMKEQIEIKKQTGDF